MGESLETEIFIYELNREESRRRRAEHRDNATKILSSRNVPHVVKNEGAHLIVCDRWDFWPGTGLFIDRKNKKKGRGIFNLLKVIRQQMKG
jgi:hypothetical protein